MFSKTNPRKKEAKNIDTEIALEKKVKELDNIICKMGQFPQTVHMLTKPQVFYDNNLKQALGFQNPFYLKKAQQIRPMLYDGNVIAKETNVISIADCEETLMLEEENFGKRFIPQRELSDEQALHPIIDQSASLPVKIEAPWELPKLHIRRSRSRSRIREVEEEKEEEANHIKLKCFCSEEYPFRGTCKESATSSHVKRERITRVTRYSSLHHNPSMLKQVIFVEEVERLEDEISTLPREILLQSRIRNNESTP
ncbi:hypothetical protein Tco_0390084 [Tanacetum coccineum]